MISILIIAAPVIAVAQTESRNAAPADKTQPQTKPSQNQSNEAIVIQSFNYAKPGKADEVLSHRQHASDVLEKIGLPRGRVMRRVGGSDDRPDVLWECEFPNTAALDQFLKTAAANPAFEQVRKHMATLIRNAERRDWEVQGGK
jgi:hypothetical protein